MNKRGLMYGVLTMSALVLMGCGTTDNEAENDSVETTQEVEELNGTDETNQEDTQESTDHTEAQYTTSVNQELIDEHETIYEGILDDYENGDYSLNDPLIVQDPYNRAPLSAMVLFDTDEPMQITVTVEGETEETTLSHTQSGYETSHEIMVLGLYPERANEVIISGETEEGTLNESTLTMETDAVPEEMLGFNLREAQPELMADGLTFLSPSRAYPVAVDSNGDVRWYSSIMTSHQLKRLDNGLLLLTTMEEGREEYDHLTEMDMLGGVHQSITVDMENVLNSAPLHHDTIILPNGNYLALLHDGSDEYVEDEIAELDRETGEVVHRINFKDIFPTEMYEDYDGHQSDVGDWMHINAVWMVEEEDAILLSVRQQDLVMKLSYPEAEVEWMLSYPEGWHEDLEGYLLESTDEDLKYPAGQHAVMEMPDQDGNDATMDIMLFDNNRIFSRGDEEHHEEYSRAVQYRINEEENTVEEIWSYGEERGTDFYSNIVSDADYIQESETVLVHSGRVLNEEEDQRYSVTVEVTHEEDSEVVYELWYGPFGADEYFQMYRAERMPLYPEN